MHQALKIEELLLNIFNHCCPSTLRTNQHKKATSDLAALARTCRAFKEPALDVLWSVLIDLSPLTRCLPEASHPSRLFPGDRLYSFSRSLTQTDWDILYGYTRRIQSVQDFDNELDRESIKILSMPPTTRPLFPNLRVLQCAYTEITMPLLQLPLPSLVSLQVDFENSQLFQSSLVSFLKFSPNITRLCISMCQTEGTFSKIERSYICRWQNLRTVICPEITLDVDALVHLSHIPALTNLSFMLSVTLQTFSSPLFFPNLHELALHSHSLDPISRLLSHTRLATMTNFLAAIGSCPSRQDLSFFFDSIQTSGADHTIRCLWLTQSVTHPSSNPRSVLLGLEDLRPCMAFSNLSFITLDIEWNVGLTNSTVLEFVSTWPRLGHLQINVGWGWNSQGGITPDGLLRLLQTCRSLCHIAVAFDTRGYTELPPSQALASLELTLPPMFLFDVLDSIIEAESVQAVTSFLSGIAAATYDFNFLYWGGPYVVEAPGMDEYMERWEHIGDRVEHQRWSEVHE
ncbi:hypothetical protein L210DRAFT_3766196 [Boletus edulis BED1]|uniref:F-box domain-containing protein n=1 Tax=Boletus edulis BED1 TaxID=1328754 RepID=A0AAD4BDS6_BOLED|nr:hypothetical protein L210DRAFT_3766196 [Boletus edulis BED1]